MPFRLTDHRAKIQFVTSAAMPSLIYKAAVATGLPSNTVYIQRAVCEALARDLDLPLDTLLSALPPPRGRAGHLFDPSDTAAARYRQRHTGPGNTIEEVR